ncbi:MAG: tRNA-specific 2-thiouridylase MnmA [Ktedonobacterales bacterium]|jgi:tRNA-specific 2-thiouridylase|nr:MAG: tRNA-specific 2-thiouridylase MnmA [Ktedonobacterales bacterium]
MTRVVVGMSGGVDSSVAAALLQEQGYDVVGIMLRLWSEPGSEEGDGVENKCCSLESQSDARRVAAQLGIPFYIVNVEQPFQEQIVDYFYDEYAAGRTPNPCLRCNRFIRFTLLLERALALGADYLATGHYVRVDNDLATGLRRLRKGASDEKDQSYVLHVLSQQQLRHALFPLGEYTKPQVRAMAAERGLPVATKAESQEICFVAANDYRGFMRRYAESTGRALPQAGPIVDETGKQLGEHAGLAHYTIGQRKGLGVSTREPLHVLKLDAGRNAVVVGPARALERETFTVKGTTYTAGAAPVAPFDAEVKVRYKAQPVAAHVTPLPEGRAEVRLAQPLRAITPGQAAVFYGGAAGEVVLGGGLIEE